MAALPPRLALPPTQAPVPQTFNPRARNSTLNTADFNTPWQFSIGGVVLERQEVPEGFDIGHEAMFAEHKFINSANKPIVRTHFQGAYPIPTRWKAVFIKARALERARQLDNLMLTGEPVVFNYGPMSFLVNIKKFVYHPKWQTEVEYEIDLIVVDDLNGNSTSLIPSNFDATMDKMYVLGTSQVTTLMNYDITVNTSMVGVNNATPTLGQKLAAAYSAFTTATEGAYPLRSQSIGTLFNISQLGYGLTSALKAYSQPLAAAGTTPSVTDLQRYASAKQALSNFTNFSSGLQKILGNTNRTPVLVSSTTNLIALAVQNYPKRNPVETAAAIAQANQLTSFFVSAGQTVYLPPIFGTNVYNSAATR